MWANTYLHLLDWALPALTIPSYLNTTLQSTTKLLSSVRNFYLLLANFTVAPSKVKQNFEIANVHLIHTLIAGLLDFFTVIPLPQLRISANTKYIVSGIPETLLRVISLGVSELVFRTPAEFLKWNSEYFII